MTTCEVRWAGHQQQKGRPVFRGSEAQSRLRVLRDENPWSLAPSIVLVVFFVVVIVLVFLFVILALAALRVLFVRLVCLEIFKN